MEQDSNIESMRPSFMLRLCFSCYHQYEFKDVLITPDRDPVRSSRHTPPTLISNLSGCSKHGQEKPLARSLCIHREVGLRKTCEWIGLERGWVRFAYHCDDGEDDARSSQFTMDSPPPRPNPYKNQVPD
jgi:hypothetical protein